jgi:hypothetical protein
MRMLFPTAAASDMSAPEAADTASAALGVECMKGDKRLLNPKPFSQERDDRSMGIEDLLRC